MSADEITPDDYRLDATPVTWAVHFIDGPDGQQVTDITRELRVMYDLVVTSMDFGSGFLDAEDMETLWHIAELCDFDFPEKEIAYAYEAADGSTMYRPAKTAAQLRAEYGGRDEYIVNEEVLEGNPVDRRMRGARSVSVTLKGRKRGER